MNNREKLNSLTDKEIATSLCYLVQEVAGKMDKDCPCPYCPVENLCSRGNNGFLAWLNQKAEAE